MSMFASYVICTSPRSGSTLLCRMLKATGIAGKPASYFYDLSVAEWCTELGIDPGTGETEHNVIEAVLQSVLRKGRNGTGLFGLRQQARGLAFLCQKLGVRYLQETTDLGRFSRAFGATQFIYLQRPNKIAQAVSLLKAQQSGLWHMAPDGTVLERVAPYGEACYDNEKLRELVQTVIAYDQGWEAWFQCEGIVPVRISYDDLAANPVAVLGYVLGCLGLNPAAANAVMPGVKKLGDNINRDWEARFRAENGLRVP